VAGYFHSSAVRGLGCREFKFRVSSFKWNQGGPSANRFAKDVQRHFLPDGRKTERYPYLNRIHLPRAEFFRGPEASAPTIWNVSIKLS
jgi:hypothetical protein